MQRESAKTAVTFTYGAQNLDSKTHKAQFISFVARLIKILGASYAF